jgi:hypothetical protein
MLDSSVEPEEGAAPTDGLGPESEVSFEDDGLSEEVAEVGLCMDVTPVLSVSCSERMALVAEVLPGRSVVPVEAGAGWLGRSVVPVEAGFVGSSVLFVVENSYYLYQNLFHSFISVRMKMGDGRWEKEKYPRSPYHTAHPQPRSLSRQRLAHDFGFQNW